MKYLSEYRDPQMVGKYLKEIRNTVTRPWKIMEICGGQTHSLVKNGLLSLLPSEITMVHGPGCPVCVTPINLIDKAVYLALEKNVILCSFGDMLRVPGSEKSLLQAKAEGADVRIVYSPLEAVKLAKKYPEQEVVFFAVGFETTAPANALSVLHAEREKLTNFSILASQVLVPPAMEAVLSDEEAKIDGFLAAGHVCTIMGTSEYQPIVDKFNIPVVVTGFEPVDLLQGILMTVRQLEGGIYQLENQYSRMVKDEGNIAARQVLEQVFEVIDREWRGIGTIPKSGYQLRAQFRAYDAQDKYQITFTEAPESADCIAGQILKGLKKPHDCGQFGKKCTPTTPLGAPMVSTEGACAAYFHFAQHEQAMQNA
ncbi:hydrogenase formation protein HypD [Catalinimonas sp. 4WD22]|uniref:hydrogenase formation protein HypD n=1 Tax=Catalinimonas locisalis TaxID=3133978 RepID=UPI003100B6BF